MGGLNAQDMEPSIATAVDFMEERLDSLGQSELASRLTLNCTPSYVQPHQVNDLPVTIINVWDVCALSQPVKEELYKCYPQAKLAHLKTGGNFPFLSKSDEVNLHIMVIEKHTAVYLLSSGIKWLINKKD
jgi:maspardin